MTGLARPKGVPGLRTSDTTAVKLFLNQGKGLNQEKKLTAYILETVALCGRNNMMGEKQWNNN